MNEDSFYLNHDVDVNHRADKTNLSDAEKIAMCEVLMDTCAAYDIPLNNLEDAENFWMLIRYGYTKQEREEQGMLYRFVSAKYPQLFKEMDEFCEEMKKEHPLLADEYEYIKTK